MTKAGHVHSRSDGVWAVATVVLVFALVVVRPLTVSAQSPGPVDDWKNYNPTITNATPAGLIVEGLGSGTCSYSLALIEQTTVHYLVTYNEPVITELTPQSICATESAYEAMVDSIAAYVAANVSADHAGQYWAGIMLDEETNFGFTAPQMLALNQHTYNTMAATPGYSFWYTELFTDGGWTQADYAALVAGSRASPQVATARMVADVNAAQSSSNNVTWSTGYPYPYNSRAYAAGSINGGAYDHNFYNNIYDDYWSNDFEPN